jgi:hypothetical protein
MSRIELTQVERSSFLKVAEHFGLNIVENKGFTKCYAPGKSKPPALGIPNTRQVTRIELVGFEHQLAVAHPQPPAKTVTQMLDFSKVNESDILHDFMAMAAFVANSGGEQVVETQAQVLAKQAEAKASAIKEFEDAMRGSGDVSEVAVEVELDLSSEPEVSAEQALLDEEAEIDRQLAAVG